MDPTHEGKSSQKLDRSLELFIVQTIFLILAGTCVTLRAIVKTIAVKFNSLDDYLIYGAMIGYLVYGVISIDGAANGATGKHFSLGYSMDQASRSLRAWYLCMVLYAPITLAIRASVCVLLLRLTTTKVHRWIIRANFGTVAAVSGALFFILVFQCSPPSYFWRQVHGAEGYCRDEMIVFYSTTVHSWVSAVSDWCLGLMPIALLWSVSLNRPTKGIIAFLLSLGMIAGIVLIIRIKYITRLKPGLEFLYRSVDVAVWSVMEPALGIIATCVATFRPLFRSWGFGWTFSRTATVRIQSSSPRLRVQTSNYEIGRVTNLHGRHSNRVQDNDVESCASERNLNIETVEIEIASEAKRQSSPWPLRN